MTILEKDFSKPLHWLDQQAHAMESLLIEWSSINSGTFHRAGLLHQADALGKAFTPLKTKIERIPLPLYSILNEKAEALPQALGDLLVIRQHPKAPYRFLLCGHMDTVYPETSSFQKPHLKENGILVGPGVADMKGGLVVMLFALRALEKSSLAEHIGWDVLINPDEEIGSPASAEYLDFYATLSQIGLVFEPAVDDKGTFASSRKGSAKLTIIVHGRSAHAGRNFAHGRNAIYGLAELLYAIDKLNEKRDTVTINAGIIRGGDAVNVVPDLALCQLDVRIEEASDAVWVHTEIQKILDALCKKEGFRAELQGGFGRKPKPLDSATEALFSTLESVAAELGLPVALTPTGGCCDGNNLAAAGLPTIDTLGVRGGAIHTQNEYMILDSLVERAKLTASLMFTLAGKNRHG